MLHTKTKEKLVQAVEDLLNIAEDFAPVIECPACDRYTKEGYICRHCGTDTSEY
jgi:hypothetical protein